MVGMTSRAAAPLLALVALAAALRGSSDALLGGAGVAAAGVDLFREVDNGDGDGGTVRRGGVARRLPPPLVLSSPAPRAVVPRSPPRRRAAPSHSFIHYLSIMCYTLHYLL